MLDAVLVFQADAVRSLVAGCKRANVDSLWLVLTRPSYLRTPVDDTKLLPVQATYGRCRFMCNEQQPRVEDLGISDLTFKRLLQMDDVEDVKFCIVFDLNQRFQLRLCKTIRGAMLQSDDLLIL